MTKCEYIAKLLQAQKIDIALIQETHLDDNALPLRYTIPRYSIVNRQNNPQYSIATYAREPAQVIHLGGSTESNGTQRSCIKIGDIYKHPTLNRDSPSVQVVNHPAVVMGDFKSHHTEWGYQDDSRLGMK
ncbi:RNA-directed DNA polymerase from mobile element jockey-like [Elysia marginata]|uniref:RNA-directed DNA polymerase from mobile element jockey-like n=1 Tax=Elysia marginata TaxID=1093978 RepID=A0AAV4IYA9_9GAST|nr:RNA-directed DNA polymerase from mobile element jockey-like [Elysia marginata]